MMMMMNQRTIVILGMTRWLEWCACNQASFCQASPGRLAVLLRAVQERWSCYCSYQSYMFDPFKHLEEPPPHCEHYGCILTVCHILVECLNKERHDWYNKGSGIYYPVCGMVHIKDNLLLIGKSSPWVASFFLAIWMVFYHVFVK